jgi:HSP20 family protein
MEEKTMTLIRRVSPFSDFLTLRRAVDRLFDESLFRPLEVEDEDVRSMPLDIYATNDELVIEAALPGFKPEDVSISVLGDRLTLTATSAASREEEKGDYMYREVRRGRCSRTVTLPAGVRTEDAAATFENGLLRLTFPKAEQAKPRQIPVRATTEGTATPVTVGSSTEGAASASGNA